jgi:hypothetical protein
MRHLPVAVFEGSFFDNNCSALIPHDPAHLPAIWAFCASPDYAAAIRRIDQALKVTNATLVKVPFDLAHWQEVASETYPNGLPEPYSDNPTQWLFHGHPAKAKKGTALHVALARVCGYRWPAEIDKDLHLSAEAREWIAKAAALPKGDNDGLLCIPVVAGEKDLSHRLRAYFLLNGVDSSQPGLVCCRGLRNSSEKATGCRAEASRSRRRGRRARSRAKWHHRRTVRRSGRGRWASCGGACW